jgi:ribosomal protein L29
MAKIEVMTKKTEQELLKLLADTRATLRTERFAAAGARAKDSNAPKNLRATVARILTEQRARTFRSIEEVVTPNVA